MSKSRHQFTPKEKYSILQEAEREGPPETARKYNLAYSVLSNWKRKYLSKGRDGLKHGYKKIDPQLRALEEENTRLKKSSPIRRLNSNSRASYLKKTMPIIRKEENDRTV